MRLPVRVAVATAAALFLAASAFAWQRARGEPAAAIGAGTPVVVELFSSEGCSSCPPADDYLMRLDAQQPVDGVAVIALEMHVDYWDRLGWTDPYGSAELSRRQRAYAAVLPDERTYTPEIVIDGAAVVSGGDEDQAAALMKRAAVGPRAKVSVAIAGEDVAVRVADAPAPPPGDACEVWLAITESHLVTRVESGENRGHTLRHGPIVRALRRLGAVQGGAFEATVPLDAASGWKRRALRAVVLVQQRDGRAIVGAGAAS